MGLIWALFSVGLASGAQLLLRQRVAIQAHKISMSCVCGQLSKVCKAHPLRQLPSKICSFVVSLCPSTRLSCVACAISWYAGTGASSSVRHRPACAGTGG